MQDVEERMPRTVEGSSGEQSCLAPPPHPAPPRAPPQKAWLLPVPWDPPEAVRLLLDSGSLGRWGSCAPAEPHPGTRNVGVKPRRVCEN